MRRNEEKEEEKEDKPHKGKKVEKLVQQYITSTTMEGNRASTIQTSFASNGNFPMGVFGSGKVWAKSKGISRIPKVHKESKGLVPTGKEGGIRKETSLDKWLSSATASRGPPDLNHEGGGRLKEGEENKVMRH